MIKYINLVSIVTLSALTVSFGQGSSLVLTKMAIADNIRYGQQFAHEKIDEARSLQLVKSTIQMVNFYKDTKSLTRDIAGATNELKDLYKAVKDDANNVHLITKEQVKDINRFFDLRNDWKKGKQQSSLGDIAGFYKSSTKVIRDKNGQLNLFSAVQNTTVIEKRMSIINDFKVLSYKFEYLKYDNYDDDVMTHLYYAELCDRKANAAQIKLNAYALGKKINNLYNSGSSILGNDNDDNNVDDTKVKKNESEIESIQRDLVESLECSRFHKEQAFDKYQLVREEQWKHIREAERSFYIDINRLAETDPKKAAELAMKKKLMDAQAIMSNKFNSSQKALPKVRSF